MEEKEKIFLELRDFIDKSWYYDNEEPDLKIINADSLLDFIKWLENEV